jgi:hypothetical protein
MAMFVSHFDVGVELALNKRVQGAEYERIDSMVAQIENGVYFILYFIGGFSFS